MRKAQSQRVKGKIESIDLPQRYEKRQKKDRKALPSFS
jgi:hypothetical protein